MKTNLKTSACILLAAIAVIASCKKSETSSPSTNTPLATNTDNYTSMANFFAKNGAAAQTYTVTNSVGGTFTTPQGTVVTIPANTFVNSLNQQVAGTVTITFKDIYKKSDMLLSNMPTTTTTGKLLKSGGEFFIKATSASTAVNLANAITVEQPLNGLPVDSSMHPYMADTTKTDTLGWALANYDADLAGTLSAYIFTLSTFNPPGSGTWCNTDDYSFSSSYTPTSLTIEEIDTTGNNDVRVSVIFKNINTVISVEQQSGNTFTFPAAPIGLQGTVVVIGVKAGKVYSSFTPITISANQTVNFSMTETTTAAFETALTALN